jgi:5-oxoprolinase (ATP-hydrolysing) subunit A
MKRRAIDLNADLGEGPGEAPLYALVSSANVACGGHTGDVASMREAVRLAVAHGVEIGAHPSYPDRDGFGRVSMTLPVAALADAIARQIDDLAQVAAGFGMALTHVKPHGALYNDAARDATIAGAIASAVLDAASDLIVVGLAGSRALDVWRDRGLRVASEGFADRAYESDGTLVPRSRPGAVLSDPARAAAQAVGLARGGRCETICVHSDTPRAAALLAEVRKALAEDGWVIAALADRIRRT